MSSTHQNDAVSGDNKDGSEKTSQASFNTFAQQLFPKKTTKEKDKDKKTEEVANEVTLTVGKKGGKKGENAVSFKAPDLVWGKVRSHPWWPAQIFEAEDASEKGRKHFRARSYLVAYFGDETFAWNDEAKIKPFGENFSQMVQQSSMEAFRHAVGCALDEVSRRVEFGLSCKCVDDEVYERVRSQVVENDGIREESRVRVGGDRVFGVSSFKPADFVEYVKSLAVEPRGEVDRLEHVVARGQMSAFYRWKGIYHLAEFSPLIGYVNNEADDPLLKQKERDEADALLSRAKEGKREVKAGGLLISEVAGKKRGKQTQKMDRLSDNSCAPPTKKVKRMSDLVCKSGSYVDHRDGVSGAKTEKKLVSSSVDRKKAAALFKNRLQMEDSTDYSSQSKESPAASSGNFKPTFNVGESILRVAGLLSQPSPLLKLEVTSDRKTAKKSKSTRKQSKAEAKKVPADCSIHNQFLTQLLSVALGSLEQNCLSSMISYFCDFRNSVAQEADLVEDLKEAGEDDNHRQCQQRSSSAGRIDVIEESSSVIKFNGNASDSEMTMVSSDIGGVIDGDVTNKVIGDPEKLSVLDGENKVAVGHEIAPKDGHSILLPCTEGRVISSQLQNGSEKCSDVLDNKNVDQEDSPTALYLKFADMDSIPSAAKLNKIFSQFGPLNESNTEVLHKRNCAKVVFKRRSDAETAFSSSGKFETFGPSLVSYRLNYAPSLSKSPSSGTKRRRKDETPIESNAA